jgi:murein DD-endopeptidase MepM/ murein hydrolase activator NlpD
MPSSTFTLLPSPTFTATPVPCNPLADDYCIQDGHFVLQRPIVPPADDKVDRGYAYGSTLGGTREPHHGVEFYNGSGTPVLAAADGTVTYAGDDRTVRYGLENGFYGNLIVLKHDLPGTTIYTLYGHLSRIDVAAGQTVTAGEQIGKVGSTGWAVGSHLHFEVRTDPQDYGSTVDPELWILPHAGNGVLAMRFDDGQGQFVRVEPNVQYYPDPNGAFTQAWQPEPYDPEVFDGNWENVLLGDIPAGRYRITYLWAGVLYERWVEVQTGKLTLVEFLVE